MLCRPQEGAIFRWLRSRRGGGVAGIKAYIWQGCWAWKRPRASTRSRNSANGKEAILSLDFPIQHLSEERGPKKAAAHSWGGGGVSKGPSVGFEGCGWVAPWGSAAPVLCSPLARALGCSALLGNHVYHHMAQGGAHPGWTWTSHAVLSGSGQGAEVQGTSAAPEPLVPGALHAAAGAGVDPRAPTAGLHLLQAVTGSPVHQPGCCCDTVPETG